MEHCGNHEQNTQDIGTLMKDVAAVKGSWSTIKWLWPIVFGAVTALLGFTISYVLADIKSALTEMKGGIQQIQRDVEEIKVSAATDRANLNALGGEISDVKLVLRQIEPRQMLLMKRGG